MATKGVDISEFNGDVNFNTLKQNGISFVIIRCGYGSDYTHQDDKYFETNVQKAEAAGMPWGTYLYSYAKDVDMAKSEAEHVLRLLKGRIPKYGVWYDLEDSQIANSNLTETSRAFCDRLESEGLYVGLYASLSWMENKLNNLSDYDKWVAQWNDECTYDGAYGLWQFTNSLSIGGKAFDGNYAYYDYPATIDKMQGVDEPEQPEETPEDKPTEVPEEKPEEPEKPGTDDSDIDEDIVNDGEVTNPPENDDNVNDGEVGDGEDEGWSVDDGKVPDEEEPEPPAHEHKWSNEWSSDGEYHWHECLNPDCPIIKNSEKDGYGVHKYDDEHDATCNVCGHVREVEPEHEHKWDTAWSYDGQHHWHECLNPDCDITDNAEKDGYGDHVFSDDQDTTCNVCGYVREVEPPKHEHEWSKDWTFSETHHWHECLNDGCDITLDKDKKDYGPHVFDSDQDAECNVCGYVREIIPDPDPGDGLTEKEVQKIVDKVIEQYFSNLEAMPADDWAETALEAVIENDIMSGDAGDLDSMRPISHTTRQEMAQVIDNALNLSATKPSNWAKKVWNKAKKAGIFDGTMPQQMITREQFAEVIVKLGLADKEE